MGENKKNKMTTTKTAGTPAAQTNKHSKVSKRGSTNDSDPSNGPSAKKPRKELPKSKTDPTTTAQSQNKSQKYKNKANTDNAKPQGKKTFKIGQKGGKKIPAKGGKGNEKPAPPVMLSNKEAHSKTKTLREERRQKDRSHYDTTVEMKKLWEDLRRQDTGEEKRAQLCETIMKLVRGKERDFVFAHDTTRIFQTLCKYASTEIRSEIFEALKDSVLEMSKSIYSAFFMRSLLKRGTREEKDYIIGKLMYHARKLITHKIAGPIAEFAYNEFANAAQRQIFAQQFYGPYFNLTMTKTDETIPLEKVLESKPEKKQYILKYMRESLESIVQKEALSYTFVHNLLYEYLKYADDIERQAMAECLQEHVAHIVHTREGAKAAMYCVWFSSAKGRKVIVKQIKPYLDKLLVEEYGHMLLFAIFDAVDDTKLVGKLIIGQIIEKLGELTQDKWGRHVILYLLKWRDPQNVNAQIRDIISAGDSNPFSKKDTDLRHKELLEQFSPALLTYTAENLSTFLESSGGKVLLFSVLKNAAGDKQQLVDALISLYNSEYNKEHPLEDKPLHNNVRKLVAADETGGYAKCFISGISPNVFKSYATSDQGCYFLACLINTVPEDEKDKFVKQISKHKATITQSQRNRPQEELLQLLT